MDREAFVKGQLEAVHKALTKYEVPLKPKHARRLIVGTHQERSAAVFWNAVNRIQLEKNPVMTWKFCHLLHKLIRDGHRKVPDESHRFLSRIKQLGQFWKHLNTSGYGICNETYSRLLAERLEFHRKYPVMPGSLILNESQIKTLENDLDNAFEMTIDMLDQMDNLLNLQSNVYDAMECLRWSSLVPQGQCLLAPLILVILDTSKFYDYLVKMIFKLHGQLPPDALEGHRTRFREVFRRTKKFYEESSNLQYFKYLVSIPTLPSAAPNFLQASDLDSYQTPHAYLRSEGSEDGQSVAADEVLLDLGSDEQRYEQQAHSAVQSDPRDEHILALTRDLEDERFAKERLIAEARSRIEQYENRLAQMQGDYEHARREADEAREESERLRRDLATRDAERIESDDVRVQEAQEQARLAEQRFSKMKAAYEKFRTEHVTALTKLGELQKEFEASEQKRLDKDEELTSISRKLEESEKSLSIVSSKAESDAAAVDEMRSQLAKADIDMEQLRQRLEHLKAEHKSQLVSASDRFVDEKAALEKKINEEIRAAVLAILLRCDEELPNVTSISYPPHLAQSGLNAFLSLLSEKDSPTEADMIVLAHSCVLSVNACAAAAYTASIQHFDEVNEQCHLVTRTAREAFSSPTLNIGSLLSETRNLQEMMTGLPLQTDVDKDIVGAELESEMRRMGEAIRAAVEEIEKIQERARVNTEGIRLEVNEAILGCCQQLMSAIMALVISSRELQMEIVAAGKGGASPHEFYKRNHQWTEGLLSAAKAVGVAARVLVESADGVVTRQGKFEQLIVAAQEIAASTAQLFVSSRVKADRDSQKLAALSVSSKNVNQCTAHVVAAVKNAQTTLNDQDNLDFSHLTLHEAKKEEMESQVRMLELEQQLVMERKKLAELRKQHYHMAQLAVAEQNGANGERDSSFEFIGKQTYRMDREGGGNENAPLLRDDQRGATVTCRVCEEQIELNGRDNQHVVKCGACHEATPIRPAPAGKNSTVGGFARRRAVIYLVTAVTALLFSVLLTIMTTTTASHHPIMYGAWALAYLIVIYLSYKFIKFWMVKLSIVLGPI
ncbi:Huntingtin interacting protein 1 [Trichostrongylus colubriformis]|uniref:phosphatidylinositol-4,5-bisphosphate 4-phosphatase n=1 Tax=Trichostrongylus colubriformis TaxID=6319 RepID=A0AAN8IGY6_TRICO